MTVERFELEALQRRVEALEAQAERADELIRLITRVHMLEAGLKVIPDVRQTATEVAYKLASDEYKQRMMGLPDRVDALTSRIATLEADEERKDLRHPVKVTYTNGTPLTLPVEDDTL